MSTKDMTLCSCNNLIPSNKVHCPYCHKFNNKTTADKCPTCQRKFKTTQESE